ncbi:MAG: putative 2-oxoglutarate--ferredoxin oxidoreductase beta subunit [Gammaproteobacteria bacterium]|nr:putative 2-oxoglutarate--ferredoxin oxidoreductase beta subunit [Gammaproteobacteria bacterium]
MNIVKVVDLPASELMIHNESADHNYLARLLASLDEDDYPVPLGVFRCIDKPRYGELLEEQIKLATRNQGRGVLRDHLRAGDTWQVN